MVETQILVDKPNPKGVLDFERYAETLAGVIVNSDPNFTIGIFGDWGTGKTSLMEMIKGKLDANPSVYTVWFNAWRYEREERLAVIPLLRTIRLSLEKTHPGKTLSLKNLKSALEATLDGLQSASATLGPVSFDIGKMVGAARSHGIFRADADTLYYDALAILDGALRDLRKNDKRIRLVVFVDDLDRCSPDRALQLLESIKGLLDINGMVYVIGMNPRIIDTVLKTKYGPTEPDSTSYMDKLVQVPFPIPSWTDTDLDAFITSLLNTLTDSQNLMANKELIRNSVERNPRQAERFLNSVIVAKAMFDRPLDKLIAIQALRFNPNWQWFLETIVLEDGERRDFFTQCGSALASGDNPAPNSRFSAPLTKVREDRSLLRFLNNGGITALLGIEHAEEYRRVLESTRIAPEASWWVEALKANPRDVNALNGKGNALWGEHKYEEAIACYDEGLVVNPSDVRLLSSKANVLMVLQNYKDAIGCYDRILGMNERDPAALTSKGNALCAEAMHDESSAPRYEEAIACYDRALEASPAYDSAPTCKGILLLGLRKYDDATKCFDRALAINPKNGTALYNESIILCLEHKADESLQLLERALGLLPYYKAIARNEVRFSSLKDDPRFQKLVEQ